MIKALGWTTVAVTVVVAGFFFRYDSLDPCEWMTQELAQYTGVPGVSGLGSTANMMMDTGQCLQNWMDLRVKGAEK
ncbi:hypothetical protein [Sneathiella chinensis]|uniref:Uncharacterized protein n=1 Tax=Sneathiella chinensis TaxID=349750 RepID=A0ABQ5U1N9_9PROT|nr:hypothetical protein [Sneathiella chinensis]GLQ05653.1 hypothetical protein GCM10007924_08740 [Sneathiella chinensis]